MSNEGKIDHAFENELNTLFRKAELEDQFDRFYDTCKIEQHTLCILDFNTANKILHMASNVLDQIDPTGKTMDTDSLDVQSRQVVIDECNLINIGIIESRLFDGDEFLKLIESYDLNVQRILANIMWPIIPDGFSIANAKYVIPIFKIKLRFYSKALELDALIKNKPTTIEAIANYTLDIFRLENSHSAKEFLIKYGMLKDMNPGWKHGKQWKGKFREAILKELKPELPKSDNTYNDWLEKYDAAEVQFNEYIQKHI